MLIELHFITGFMVGFEFVSEESANHAVLDLGIARLMFTFFKD